MGWEERARRQSRKFVPGTVCYLCNKAIATEAEANRDHVPARSYFPKRIKQQFNPNLDWLWTHTSCNASIHLHEDYFLASIGPMATNRIGEQLRHDLREAYTRHEQQRRLGEMVLQEFGKTALPNGLIYKTYKPARVNAVLWKIVRGLHRIETGLILPPDLPRVFAIYPSPEELQTNLLPQRWWPTLRDTQPMGRYGEVLDYKVIGYVDFSDDGAIHTSAQIWGLLLWNQIVATVMFHNSTCPCPSCAARRAEAAENDGSRVIAPIDGE